MRKFLCVLFVMTVCFSWTYSEDFRAAPETVIVTADNMEEELEDVSSAVTIITKKEIEEKSATTLPELMRQIPGIRMNKNGTSGASSSLMIRGADTDQTLVLINGSPVNNPTLGTFDLSQIMLEGVQRIEISRGQGSAVHGSQAGGGVVNIITDRGQKGYRLYTEIGGGNNDTKKGTLNLSGGSEHIQGFLSYGGYETDNEFDNDSYKNSTYQGGITANTDAGKLTLSVRQTDRTNHLAMPITTAGEWDPNAYQENEDKYYALDYDLSLLDGKWKQKVNASYFDSELTYSNDSDPDDSFNSTYDSQTEINRRFLKLTEQYRFNDNVRSLGGFEYRESEGDFYSLSTSMFGDSTKSYDEKIKDKAYFTELKLDYEKFRTTAGIRHDNYEDFGSDTNYDLGLAYDSELFGTTFRASYGTSFSVPTLNELYFPGYSGTYVGNPNLEPQEGEGWEVGMKGSYINNRWDIEINLFSNEYTNLITYDSSTGTYINLNDTETETEGVEFITGISFPHNYSLSANYTYLNTEKNENDEQLERRPEKKYSLTFVKNVEHFTAGLEGNYVGSRRDEISWLNYPDKLPSYKTLDIFLKMDLTKNTFLKARVDNVTDEEYMDLNGYPALGRNYLITAGFEITGK